MTSGPHLQVVVAAVVVVLQTEGGELEPDAFPGRTKNDPGAIPVVWVPGRVARRLDAAVGLEKIGTAVVL